MKIYTKTGDDGTTALASGERVSKASLRVEAYGSVDELNSFVGLFRTQIQSTQLIKSQIDPFLLEIQIELFNLGTHLSSQNISKAPPIKLKHDFCSQLESHMDLMTAQLPPLKNFILPGGSTSASTAHIVRTVCRRAERLVVQVHESEPLDPQVILHLNRLSDFFFTLARYCNFVEKSPEVLWKP